MPVRCSSCNNPLEDTTLQKNDSCPNCGGANKTFNLTVEEKVTIRDGLGRKAKRPGAKKPYIEDLSIPDHSHKLQKVVHRARTIDRDNDRYFEKITDYETGETIHHCEEPLSQHQGHGSAKKKHD